MKKFEKGDVIRKGNLKRKIVSGNKTVVTILVLYDKANPSFVGTKVKIVNSFDDLWELDSSTEIRKLLKKYYEAQ